MSLCPVALGADQLQRQLRQDYQSGSRLPSAIDLLEACDLLASNPPPAPGTFFLAQLSSPF